MRAAWAGGRAAALPWKWQIERTRVDPLMGAPLEWEQSRAHVLRTRCQAPRLEQGAARRGAGLPGTPAVRARPLRWLVPPEQQEWPVGCTAEKAALCDVVRRVAKRRQVLLTVSSHIAQTLPLTLT